MGEKEEYLRTHKRKIYHYLIKEKGFPFHGRFFISPDENSQNNEISFEWKIPSEFTHFHLKLNGEEKVFSLSIANPLLSFWVGYKNYKIGNFLNKIIKPQLGMSYAKDKEIHFSFHNNSIYWSIWSTNLGWSNNLPRWKSGSFDFADFILGKSDYWNEDIDKMDVEIKMPEATYKGKAKLFVSHWKRPRWFEKTMNRVNIDVPEGIPIPGKGESSYDCGPDATYSIICPVNSIYQGVNKLIESCIKTRLERCGNINYSERDMEKTNNSGEINENKFSWL